MFAFVFKDWKQELDIYPSEYIGDTMTKGARTAGITAVIYIAM